MVFYPLMLVYVHVLSANLKCFLLISVSNGEVMQDMKFTFFQALIIC